MLKPMKIEVRCRLSKWFPSTLGAYGLGRYTLEALPTTFGGAQEAILTFIDAPKTSHSNPQEEGAMFLAVLALIFDSKIASTGVRINGIDIGRDMPTSRRLDGMFAGDIPNEDHLSFTKHLATLGEQLAKQFVRACKAYSLAITASELDASLSFLLLVTAIESISSQEEFCPHKELDKTKKSTERYCRLVIQYCLHKNELYPTDGEDGFLRDLKTVYYVHRSGFVHAGKEVSIASEIADRHGFNNLSHIEDGKDVFTPGLKWFFRVTRRTLLGFLSGFPRKTDTPNETVLADIARDRGVLTMRWGGQ